MPPTERGSPGHVCLMSCGIPTDSVKRRNGSSISRWLRSGALGGCTNCVFLEGIVEAERKARRQACCNMTEAHKRCLDMGTILYDLGLALQKANDKLRAI
ncbi:hypothetical protein PanWU01x14_132340 [Parasponia andersonii]|uniref:Uncharacterized protein n=1 Tax=Parasponia andersonii TaxID=3476 RepID=A0A2P5CQI7_PARAD|nr:hypothetical protein PanWU01x14_132340 [Parasponia andersonii]